MCGRTLRRTRLGCPSWPNIKLLVGVGSKTSTQLDKTGVAWCGLAFSCSFLSPARWNSGCCRWHYSQQEAASQRYTRLASFNIYYHIYIYIIFAYICMISAHFGPLAGQSTRDWLVCGVHWWDIWQVSLAQMASRMATYMQVTPASPRKRLQALGCSMLQLHVASHVAFISRRLLEERENIYRNI